MNDTEVLERIKALCEQTIRDVETMAPGDHMSGRKAMAQFVLRAIRDLSEPPFEKVLDAGKAHMVKIDGKSFRCECQCNIFVRMADNENPEFFRCNACGRDYAP